MQSETKTATAESKKKASEYDDAVKQNELCTGCGNNNESAVRFISTPCSECARRIRVDYYVPNNRISKQDH